MQFLKESLCVDSKVTLNSKEIYFGLRLKGQKRGRQMLIEKSITKTIEDVNGRRLLKITSLDNGKMLGNY